MAAPYIATGIARSEACFEAGDIDGARAAAQAVLAADPVQPAAHNILGVIAHREGRLVDAQRELELACSLAGVDDDTRANLDRVRGELAEIYTLAGRQQAPAPTQAPPELDFGGSFEDLRRGAYGQDLSPSLLGRLLGAPVDASLQERLDQIPTATTASERRFLLRFTARFWDGRGDVFENGPLLGGSTRALALGMLANAARDAGALLQTHDWFNSRVPLDLPAGTWETMVARGQITKDQHDEMLASGTFQPLFDALHSGWDYSPLVRSHVAYLPGASDDTLEHGEAVFKPPDRVFSLVFVDGCKSWYGTKHWIMRMCDRVPRGAHFIFQDYGWYTCFWLPALVGLLPDHFRLVGHVDTTYVFELRRELDAAALDARFPDQPAGLGRDGLDDLFVRLGIDAGARSDVHAMVALAIQHAGSLAYIGFADEARHYIASLRARPEFAHFRSAYIDQALRSPTYTPEGPLLL